MTLSKPAPQQLSARLQLPPRPEGGYYRETYLSTAAVMRSSDDAHSSWHGSKQMDLTPLRRHAVALRHDGNLRTLRLGDAMRHDAVQFQAMVPAG